MIRTELDTWVSVCELAIFATIFALFELLVHFLGGHPYTLAEGLFGIAMFGAGFWIGNRIRRPK